MAYIALHLLHCIRYVAYIALYTLRSMHWIALGGGDRDAQTATVNSALNPPSVEIFRQLSQEKSVVS